MFVSVDIGSDNGDVTIVPAVFLYEFEYFSRGESYFGPWVRGRDDIYRALVFSPVWFCFKEIFFYVLDIRSAGESPGFFEYDRLFDLKLAFSDDIEEFRISFFSGREQICRVDVFGRGIIRIELFGIEAQGDVGLSGGP